MKHNSLKISLLALLVMALWGSLFPMIKIGYAAFHITSAMIPAIIVFAGVRFTACGVLLVGASSVASRRLALPKKSELPVILFGALATVILHYTLTYVALAIGEGSKSAIVKQIAFLFLSCFAFLFDKSDRFTLGKLLAGLLGFLGIVVTAIDGGGVHFAVGDLLLVLSSFCSVAGTLIARRAPATLSPTRYTGYSQLFGGVVLLVLGLCLGGRITHFDARAFFVFLYICAASIGAYVIWNSIVRVGRLSTLSLFKFTEPLFAVLFSAILLGEDILRLTYLFALLILLLAMLVEHQPWRRPNESNRL